MLMRRLLSVFLFLVTLTACAAGPIGVARSAPEGIVRSYTIADFRFSAASDLSVSENEGYYPLADVVWRGDPRGPRIPQIAAMFETAMERNKPVLRGRQPVAVDVQLVRFHGVTDRTRFSVGGVYNIVFLMTVRDAATGQVIEPTRRVVANLDAPGGAQAARLEVSGQTQKVRVTDFLTAVLRRELL